MGYVKDLRGRVENAMSLWDKYLQETQLFVDLYRPTRRVEVYGGVAIPEDQKAKVNLVWAYIQGILPGLLYQPPYAFVDPVRTEDREKAEVLEKVLNYEIERVAWLREARSVVVEALLRGWGVSKVGLEYEGVIRQSSGEFGQEGQIQPRVTFARIPTDEFVWEPGVPLHKARWCCHFWAEPIESVKDNPMYRNTKGIKPTRVGGRILSNAEQGAKFSESEAEPEYVLIYEIWVRHLGNLRRQRIILAEDHDQVLSRSDWPFDEWPFDILVFHEDPMEQLPGLSDIAPWATIQQAANVYLTKLISHIARSGVKIFVDSTIPQESVDRLVRTRDLAVLPVDTGGRPIREMVQELEIAPASPDLWNGISFLEKLFSEISGWTPQMPSQVETATEASIFQSQAASRIDDRKMNGVAFWADKVLRKMLHVIQRYYDEGAVPYLGADGRREFQEFTASDLDADVMLRVEFGHTSRQSDQQRAQNYLQMLNLLSPFLASAGGIPEPMREFLRRLMKDVLHWPDAERLLPPVAPLSNPAMENAEMALGNPVIVLPQHQHSLHIPVHENFLKTLDPEADDDVIQIVMAHIQEHQKALAGGVIQGTGALNEMVGGYAGGRPPAPEQTVGSEIPQGE